MIRPLLAHWAVVVHVVKTRVGLHAVNILHCTYYGIVSTEHHGPMVWVAGSLVVCTVIELVHTEKHHGSSH